ncbi:hypothetical protein [Nocardia sp. NPDC003979]
MNLVAHAGVSLAAPAAVCLAAGQTPSPSLLVWGLVGGVLVDLIDHAVFQVRFARSYPNLREAWTQLANREFHGAFVLFGRIERERQIDRLILHSRGGLAALTVLSIIAISITDSRQLAAAALSAVLALHCDVLWDWREVGHARNWFGRPVMIGSSGSKWPKRQAAHFWLTWPFAYVGLLSIGWQLYFLVRPSTGKSLVGQYFSVLLPLSWIVSIFLMIGISCLLVWRRRLELGVDFRVLHLPWAKYRNLHTAPSLLARLLRVWRFLVINHALFAVVLGAVVSALVAILAWAAHSISKISLPVIGDNLLAIAMAISVLIPSLIVTYFINSTAGALGGLLGAAVGVSLAVTVVGSGATLADHPGALTAALAAAILSWIAGLLFLFLPGRDRSSVSFAIFELPDVPGESVEASINSVAEICHDALDEMSALTRIFTPGKPVEEHRPPLAVINGSSGVSFDTGGRLMTMGLEFFPRQLELTAPLLPTFTLVAPSVPYLEPRGEADITPAVKSLSEVLDNFMTRKALLICDIVLTEGNHGRKRKLLVRCYEQTSTKEYATPHSRILRKSIQERVSDAVGIHCRTSADLHSNSGPYPVYGLSWQTTVPSISMADIDEVRSEADLLGKQKRHSGSRKGIAAVAQLVTLVSIVVRIATLLN